MNPQNKELHFLTSSQWNTVKKNSDAEPQPTILAGLLNLKLNMCLFLYLCCSNASQGNGYAILPPANEMNTILPPANEMVTLFYHQPMKRLCYSTYSQWNHWNGCTILPPANEMVTLFYRQPMKWLAILPPANEMVSLFYCQPMKWLAILPPANEMVSYPTASQWNGYANIPPANEMVTQLYRQPMKWLRYSTSSQWNGCAILQPANEMVALFYSQPMKGLSFSTWSSSSVSLMMKTVCWAPVPIYRSSW